MVPLFHFTAGLLLAGTAHSAAVSVQPRLAHNKVKPFPQAVPDNWLGQLYLKHKPYLAVLSGCLPFPAVDPQGNVNDGLDTGDGDQSNECDFGDGQVYVRSAFKDGKLGIMYSWYFPKDVPSIWLGHCHDWENIVLWFSNATDADSAQYIGTAIQEHGKYDHKYPNGNGDFHFDGSRPLLAYTNIWPVDHHLDVTDKKGREQPLIAYEMMTDIAFQNMDKYDFGEADFPFGTKNFNNNMAGSQM